MKRGLIDFACPIAATTVKVTLRHGGGLYEPDRVYVRCDQRDCQYVDLNEPPCPLRVDMFGDDGDRRVADYLHARAGRLVCYACVTEVLGIDHDQARRASWQLKDTPTFTIRPARCSECRRRRVTIGFLRDPNAAPEMEAPAAANDGAVSAERPDNEPPSNHEPGAVEAYLRSQPGYWLCAHCVAREAQTDVETVRGVIYGLDRREGFRMSTAQCVSCLLVKRVVRWDESANEDDAGARILGALFQHAGDAMCAACLAFATDAGLADVKRVLGYLEPLPEFVRRTDACAVCGRWQPVVAAGSFEGVDGERLGVLRGMVAGTVWHSKCRIELLSFRTVEGWRPFALVKTGSRALVPDAPAMVVTVLSSKAAADEAAAAHARQWIDKRPLS